jgi:hypothetical protein
LSRRLAGRMSRLLPALSRDGDGRLFSLASVIWLWALPLVCAGGASYRRWIRDDCLLVAIWVGRGGWRQEAEANGLGVSRFAGIQPADRPFRRSWIGRSRLWSTCHLPVVVWRAVARSVGVASRSLGGVGGRRLNATPSVAPRWSTCAALVDVCSAGRRVQPWSTDAAVVDQCSRGRPVQRRRHAPAPARRLLRRDPANWSSRLGTVSASVAG